MDSQTLVGVLLDTSSLRVAVYDLQGNLLKSQTASIAEQSTSAWERALREATPKLADATICSVASTSGTALLTDEYGEPVFPPQMYYETAPAQARTLRASVEGIGDDEWEIVCSPTAPLPKIIHLKEQYPTRFENVEWILSPTTWLLYRLRYGNSQRWRGVETDWTNALKFGADIRPSLPTWYDGLFEAAELSPSLFPAIRPPGSFIAVANSEFASRIGFDGCRLFQGVTDGAASVLANGCLEPGDFSVTFGDTSVIKFVSKSIKHHDSLYYHRHPIDGYVPGTSFDSGNALRWFSEHALNIPVERGLELASSAPPGEENQVYLPGDRGLLRDPNLGLSILGLDYDQSLSTDQVQGRLTRGLALGIILTEWGYLSLIEDHFDTRIEDIRVMDTGGPNLERHEWWNQLRASVWGRQVTVMDARTTAGLLIPATLITSLYDTPAEATDALLRQRSTVEPDPELSEQYEQSKDGFFDRWEQVASVYER